LIDGHSLKAVIFDMDGTLVSSLSTIMHCENEISLKYKNQPLTLEDVIANFGPPVSQRNYRLEQYPTITNAIARLPQAQC